MAWFLGVNVNDHFNAMVSKSILTISKCRAIYTFHVPHVKNDSPHQLFVLVLSISMLFPLYIPSEVFIFCFTESAP